jgi:sugar phosphate isomerase/epimerase
MIMQIIWATPGFDDWPLKKWHSVLQTLSDCKYFGIEPLIAEPYCLEGGKIKELLKQYKLTLYGLRTGGITMKHEVNFNHPNATGRKEAVERFKEVIHYASQFGRPRLLVGLIQGSLQKNQSITEAEDNIQSCLWECAQEAEQFQIEIDLEPVNRYELNYHNTAISVQNFIQRIGMSNIRLLVDTFHMNIEESCIEQSLIDIGESLGHVHLSDSNRSIPGKGHIDFEAFFRTLKDISYKGNLTIEAITESDPSDIVETISFLKYFSY